MFGVLQRLGRLLGLLDCNSSKAFRQLYILDGEDVCMPQDKQGIIDGTEVVGHLGVVLFACQPSQANTFFGWNLALRLRNNHNVCPV